MDLRRRLYTALIVLLVITATSVAGYMLLGGPEVKLLDAIYMAIITLAGVGYGEFVDTGSNPVLRVFNMFVVLVGVTLTVYVFSVVTAFLVEGEITDIFRRRKMLKRVAQLKDHYIVCGLGDTGRNAVEELQKTGTPYAVIEHSDEVVQRFREHAGADYAEMLHVVGDATDEEVLEAAGVDRAIGLITTLPHDKDNLVVTVVTRQKNAAIRIVARVVDARYSERMLKAGANSTVSPNRIGGMRLASEVLRPQVVGFLDLMLKEQSRTLRVEELAIDAASTWNGRQLGEVGLRSRYNLLPLAVKNVRDPNGANFWVNPPDMVTLKEGLVVIVIGDVKDVQRARQDSRHHSMAAALRG